MKSETEDGILEMTEMSYTEPFILAYTINFEIITYQNYNLIQQALGQQGVFFSAIRPLCTKEISEGQRYLAMRVAKELDGKATAIGLA